MSVIDEYLSSVSEPQKAELNRVRKIVKQAVPEADEVISYGIPAFKYKGKYLIGYAAFKNHMSIFPGSAPILAQKNELKDYKTSKGTIQFTLEHPIPEPLLKQIIVSCLTEINNR